VLHSSRQETPLPIPQSKLQLDFDRGTILLTATGVQNPSTDALNTFTDIPRIKPKDLPDCVWDPRVQSYRVPGFRHQGLVSNLEREKIPFSDRVKSTLPDPEGWGRVELRDYQKAALQAWYLDSNRGIVVLPTGSGKTRLALAAMAGTKSRSLILVPTRVLLHQWMQEISRIYAGPVGLLGDHHRKICPVTVTTFESAYRWMPRIGNQFDLLVVDEAHHFGGGLRDEALELSTAAARLGLTATPSRKSEVLDRLSILIGPTVFEMKIDDLAGTHLKDFQILVLYLDLSPEERFAYELDARIYREALARFQKLVPDADWVSFAKSASRSIGGREALAAFRRVRHLLGFTKAKNRMLGMLLERHRDSRVLVFTADNDTAYAISREHLIMPLTCDIGHKERDSVLESFRHGDLSALVSSRVLNEGVDVPDADVGIIVAGAQGEREHVQRVGRLLRPARGKQAVIYELVTRGTREVHQGQKRRVSLGSRVSHSL